MAVYREAPTCPKCGKKMRGVYNKQIGVPVAMKLIGDTFLRWEHDGPCAEPTESSKGLLKFITNDNPSSEDFYKSRGIVIGCDPAAVPGRTVLTAFDSEGNVLSWKSVHPIHMSYTISGPDKTILTYCVATKREDDQIEILECDFKYLSKFQKEKDEDIKSFIEEYESKYQGIEIKQMK
jgi:hypothetical protein